jgi:dTDP-4-amino-4,6-dideoxygalactose transaminase
MRILFNNFQKTYKDKKGSIDKAIARVCNSGRFVLGEEVAKFESSFASYIGSGYTIGVGNGLEALQIALMALEIGPGGEVITTSLSAVATALAIKAVGAKPVFADIDDYYDIDPASIEKNITSKTKAIIPVHLYGQAADMTKIMNIAKKHKLHVVEDCAQAHGAKFQGKKVGTFGIFGCFSFYPTKNLGAFGDGGAIVTNDKKLADKCRMLRNYGQKNRYEHEVTGINSRLDEMQATILSVLLSDLDKSNKKRNMIAESYRSQLSSLDKISLPKTRDGVEHIFHLFVIETDKRDELQDFLKQKGIDSLIHYPIPIHKQKCFSEYNSVSLPKVEKKVSKILSLPIHPYLEQKEIDAICKAIKEFFGKK